jgi:hypothetical protein
MGVSAEIPAPNAEEAAAVTLRTQTGSRRNDAALTLVGTIGRT